MLKSLARNVAVKFLAERGYGLVKTNIETATLDNSSTFEERYEALVAAYTHERTMRDIHKRDVAELLELYKAFVLPGLEAKEDREHVLAELIGTTVGEGIYLIYHLQEALKVEGDICEFGVAQGATSRLIASEIMATERTLWLFDSFEGLPAPAKEDRLIDDIFNLGSIDKYEGTMRCQEEEVRRKLAGIQFPEARTRILKGWIKESLKRSDLPTTVAFAYVDFDFYEPIRDALEYLDRVMPAGGRILVDDYGFFSEGAQLAVDQFRAERPHFSFEMPLPAAGHFAMLIKNT